MYSHIADVYHEIFPLNATFINFVKPYLGPPGSRILDLGCGPGDYIHKFSENYEGMGIDANAEMIKLAKSKNKGRFFQMPFEEIDQLEGLFSCIFCIGNSLSYLSNESTIEFFQNINRLINPVNGYFILQVVNWDRYKNTGNMDFPVKALEDGRTFHRSYTPRDENAVFFQTRIQDKEKILGSWSDTLFPKVSTQLASDMTTSRLEVLSLFGDFKKSAFNASTSPAIIVVSRKAE